MIVLCWHGNREPVDIFQKKKHPIDMQEIEQIVLSQI
jgi:hypothetical protein